MKFESKLLTVLVIASMVLSVVPVSAVSMTIALSTSFGPVGTKVTVTGTIVSYNGSYLIVVDTDKDNVSPIVGLNVFPDAGDAVFGPYDAAGYVVNKEIEIPDAYEGGNNVWLVDTNVGGPQQKLDTFTVLTSYKFTVAEDFVYVGGPETYTLVIKGAPQLWNGIASQRFRLKNPSGTVISTWANAPIVETTFGHYSISNTTIGPNSVKMITEGTWSVVSDIDPLGGIAYANAKTVTFGVRLSDKAVYERTQPVIVNYYVPAGKTLDKVSYIDPDGVETIVIPSPMALVGPGFLGPSLLLATVKDSPLGVYTMKFYYTSGSVTQTFTLNKANIIITLAPADLTQTNSFGLNQAITTVLNDVQRMCTVKMIVTLTYPDGSPANSVDLPSGFAVDTYYNTTKAATTTLNALTDYTAPNIWTVEWKVPKDAVLGKGYTLNVTKATMVDAYGNTGPEKNFGSLSVTQFVVEKGVLYLTAGPTLSFPAAGNDLQRTLTAKATAEVRYADNSRIVGSDLSIFNATVFTDGDAGALAADYNADVGLWIVKYVIAYDAALGAGNTFTINANDVVDKWGNKGPLAPSAPSAPFGIKVATIAVSDLATSAATYATDSQVVATFKAKYPGGQDVTTRAATFPIVNFVDADGNIIVAKRAGYSETTGLWSATALVGGDWLGGTWTVEVDKNQVVDDAAVPNVGPATDVIAEFDITRVSLTDVLAAANAAKAAADAASVKADAATAAATAASTAATAAGTKADAAAAAATAAQTAATGAQTAATAAGTKADAATAAATAAGTAATAAGTAATAAKTAADAAKASADAVSAKIDSLTTLVYAAIGAALIAAIAAIVALMMINRKIA